MSETERVETETAAGVDLTRLNEVVTYAEDHPREFDMVHWLKQRCDGDPVTGDHVCGRAGCLAGTALRLYEDGEVVARLFADIIAPQNHLSEHGTKMLDEYGRLSQARVEAEDVIKKHARDILRLSDNEADRLFEPDGNEVIDEDTGFLFDVDRVTSENVRRFAECALGVDLPRTAAEPTRCPTCDSPDPRHHPATGSEGEVYRICLDPFHRGAGEDAGNAVARPQDM